MAENSSFTFWSNMKEAIDIYDDEIYKYKLYDALTEYGLYGIWPEDDGTIESRNIIAFIQLLVPSLDKSHNFSKKVTESGAAGGRKQKTTDEQLIVAIQTAAKIKMGVPTRQEVVDQVLALYKVNVSTKTISRRFSDEEKQNIALKYLEDIGDKNNVPQGQNLSLEEEGQNRDKIDVPDVPEDKIGTQGQNGGKINVPGGFIF